MLNTKRKKKAFNFVELMLVLMVLGVVAALTFPIIQNIKDDDDIYRAYMKKAVQDVSDAALMGLMKNRYFTGYNRLKTMDHIDGGEFYSADSDGLRYAFNFAINGAECGTISGAPGTTFKKGANGGVAPCLANQFPAVPAIAATATTPARPAIATTTEDTPGIVYGKTVMLFLKEDIAETATTPAGYGYVYVDMNGDKRPNTLCQDRYRFIIYRNRASLDATAGCTFDI